MKGRLYTFSIFLAFKIHNSVSMWVKITKKPNGIERPSWCFARKQSSNFETGCDVINRWIIGTRNFAKSWGPPPPCVAHKHNKWLQILVWEDFPPKLLKSENADFKFSVNNEGEDVNKKARSRRNIDEHSEGNPDNNRQRNRRLEAKEL